MKFTSYYKAAFISAAFFAAAVCISLPSIATNPQCQSLSTPSAIEDCYKATEQSWLSWFRGKSRSTQFHFVDLLELLSRLSPAQKP
jgi:hypothetical protein